MKKKISVSMAIAVVVSLLLISVAIAASLGVFGQFAEFPDTGREIDSLEDTAMVYGQTQTIPSASPEQNRDEPQDDYTAILERQKNRSLQVTLEQGYFDGHKVAISYTIHEADKASTVLAEGVPTGDIPWNMEMEGGRYVDDMWPPDELAGNIKEYLDAQGPIYIILDQATLGDGLFLADGTPLENVTSGEETNSNGDLMGYKTYQGVPEAYQDAESIQVYCTVHRFSKLIYQDKTGYKVAWISAPGQAEIMKFEFTLMRNATAATQSVEAEYAQYSVKAEVRIAQVGAACTITMECPESWVKASVGTGEIDPDEDYISYYQLYADDTKCPFMSGSSHQEDATHMTWEDEFTLPESYDLLRLVPVYKEAGENWDEAIDLQ